MRPPPTTAEYVEMLAAREPLRLALREDGTAVTYGQLATILQQCGLELQRLGVRQGQRVAVAGPGFGIQLALLLACEAMGVATASFQAEGDADAQALFGRVDWVLAAQPQAPPPGVRFQQIDAAFAQRIGAPLQGAGPVWTPAAPDAPARITRTSGSSGAAKFMLLRRRAQEWWIRTALDTWQWDMDSSTRLLMLSPLVINAGFARVCGCLRRGAAVLVGDGSDIEAMDPTHIIGLPLQLERLLAELPAGYAAWRPVSVATFGGTASPALRERAQALFGGQIYNRYGSNEAGAICDALDENGTGVLGAGVDVRILDANGQDVPAGQDGIIALRTPSLVEGYLGLPEETAAAFRDGWFLSGDVGALVGRRLLRLAGRHDDLIAVAGIKVPAAQLEAKIAAQPAIASCAVLTINLQGGAVTLGVALVLAPGATVDEGQAQLQTALQLVSTTEARVLFLSDLPRLPGGKVDRLALLRLFK
ncbi:MAG: malonyl-CoA synthase [Ramlibacter sp.]|nr:malonyl-CoA synthase [Ramlibacter sp.]